MKDYDVNWRNTSYVLDGQYVAMAEAPILKEMIEANDNLFWDGEYYYKIESTYIKKWPHWRNKFRLPMEKHR